MFTFKPGSAEPESTNPTEAGRLRRWRQVIRPDIPLVLLQGVADRSEPGYTDDLGLRRAQAVRTLLIKLGIDPTAIWTRGETVTAAPAMPVGLEAVMGRSVTVGDPLRALTCERTLFQARFRWFISHCSGQTITAATQKVCDMADVQLGGEHPPIATQR